MPPLIAAAPRIIVVEHQRVVAKELQRCLRGMGYDVPKAFHSAADALRAVLALSPDVVVLDSQIGGALKGFEAAGFLHRDHDLPVILLTTARTSGADKISISGRNTLVVQKPVVETQLRHTIEVALAQERTSGRWLATMLASQRHAVIAADDEGHVTAISPAVEKLTGWTAAEVIGRVLFEIFGFRQQAVELCIQARRDGSATSALRCEHLLPTRVGETVPIVYYGAKASGSAGFLIALRALRRPPA